MQYNSKKYDKIGIKVNIFVRFVGMLHNLMLKLPYFAKNMCEEGSESRFGSEESLNVFRTLEFHCFKFI